MESMYSFWSFLGKSKLVIGVFRRRHSCWRELMWDDEMYDWMREGSFMREASTHLLERQYWCLLFFIRWLEMLILCD